MNTNESNPWQQFDESAVTGLETSLGFLKEHFRETQQYHRLFDVMKMELRKELNLPLLHSADNPELDDETQKRLEDGLLEACRELSKVYFAEGMLEDGWVYLQPVSDEPFAKELIQAVAVTEENFNTIIEIAFNQGVSPVYGFGVMLRESGTCNGITAFDVHAAHFDRETITGLASVLLNHFYDELLGNVISHIESEKGAVDKSSSLDALLAEHDWLVREGGHHIDATHLASVTRIARQTTCTHDHERALAIAQYGCRLGDDFKFTSDPPFQDIYEDHRIWFEALVGQNVESAIAHFTTKADDSKGQYGESACVEALMDLAIMAGDRDAAVKIAVERLWPMLEPGNLPPSAFEIAKTAAQFEAIADAFQSQENFAGYAFARIKAQEAAGGRGEP